MKPAPFEYHRPDTLAAALALLAEHGPEAKPLAGGQSLIPAMNFRLARPAVLVDLNGLEELNFVEEWSAGLRIGAMTRQRTVERSDAVARLVPLLAEAIPFVAHVQIRNRGTVGGSIAHADPAGELAAVMLGLDARLRLQGPQGERWLPVEQFFTGLFATALAPGELLTEITVPGLGPRTGWAFAEVARRHGDYALAGAAAMLTLDAAGRCRAARVALLGVGEGPVLARKAMKALAGEALAPKTLTAAARAAAEKDIDPPSDIHASAAYRRQLVAVLTERVLARAAARSAASAEAGPA